MVAILLARNLLPNSPESLIGRTIQSFGRKLFAAMGQIGFRRDTLQDAFSAVLNGYAPSQGSTFRVVLNALLKNRLLSCRYTSPAGGLETERTIAPHQLRQIWHRDQKMELLPDGGLRLTLPVSDFREIKLRVLQFGADVEVIEPEALRREIGEEIEKMTKIYPIS